MKQLRHLRIRTQLGLVLIAPLVAVLAFAGVASAGFWTKALDANEAVRWTALAGDASALAYSLEVERIAGAVMLTAAPGTVSNAEFAVATSRTDETIAAYARNAELVRGRSAEFGGVLSRVDAGIQELADIRAQVYQDKGVTASGTALRYRLLIADLLVLHQVPGLLGLPSDLGDLTRAASALAQVVEQTALQGQVVLSVAGDRLSPAAWQRVAAARTGFDEGIREFTTLAPPTWRTWWEQTVTGPSVLDAQRLSGAVARTRLDTPLELDKGAWTKAMAGQLALMRSVVARADADTLRRVELYRQSQLRNAEFTVGALLLVLLVAVVIGFRVARSLSRRLGALRTTAIVTATKRLPEVIAALHGKRALTGTVEDVVASADLPEVISGSDEIAEVGKAFDIAAREAVRHAAEQAITRERAAQMFIGLARRQQQLMEQMLVRLDTVERDEMDPQRLEALFGLDHVATRMGRYTDSLLVLAGTGSARPRSEPVELWDLMRAAAGQIEKYQRIHYTQVDSGVMVAAQAVDHIVHALAELLDNATAYSPPDQPVEVSARRIGDRVLILITDQGIGIAPDTLDLINARLAAPPQLDMVTVRSMGLAAVATIAAWHQLQVRLHPGPGGVGTVAETQLPTSALLLLPRHARFVPSDNGWTPVPRPLERPREQVRQFATAGSAAVYGGWASDNGWKTASDLTQSMPVVNGFGLPVRDPGARLVPGGFEKMQTVATAPVDARRLAAQMRSYQAGLAQGRRTQPVTISAQ